MALATRVCHLCRAVVVVNKWASRIGQLLEIPVDDGISPSVRWARFP